MQKILSVVPVLACADWTSACMSGISASDIFVIDNNAEKDVKKVVKPFKKIVNKKNMYVNYAWNQGMEYFLEHKEYDFIAIINSDLRLIRGWEHFCLKFFKNCFMHPIVVPGGKMPKQIRMNPQFRKVPGGHPGIFIFMNREMVKMVYPIPDELKLWFGDNWIYWKCGYEQRVYFNLKAEHGNSRSISTIPDLVAMVEKDRQHWEQIGKKI